MNELGFAFVLLAYLIASHVYFLYLINKLVNKVMSRSFGEYQANKEKKEKKSALRLMDDMSDVKSLEGIGI